MAPSPWRCDFVQTRAARLYVESQGDGPLLICLHGLGGGAYFFRGLGQRLSDQYRVLALDMPGSGHSRESNSPPFTIQGCVEALLDLIAAQPAGKVSVLGHSMGTLVALLAIAQSPKAIHSALFSGGLPQPMESIRLRLAGRADKIKAQGKMVGIGQDASSGVFATQSKKTRPEAVAMFAALLDAQPADIYLQCLEALITASAWPVVDQIVIPTLTMTGSEDPYAPPAEARRMAAALKVPSRYVEFPDCGHMPFFECPEAFAEEIRTFLAST